MGQSETEKQITNGVPPTTAHIQSASGWSLNRLLLLTWAGTLALISYPLWSKSDVALSISSLSDFTTRSRTTCNAPAPNLFAYHPPRSSHELIAKASKDVEKYLSDRASKTDIDSIAVSIVTAAGPIFEGGYGTLKANETETEDAYGVDRDSIYRIASISKMFTVLETLILREKGALNWEDPVVKYLPTFKPPSDGWSQHLAGLNGPVDTPQITLRQLASHLAGIGRDLPFTDVGDWPLHDLPQINGTEDLTYDDIMNTISRYPLINTPYAYPIYSNTGFDVLGFSNIAANKMASSTPAKEPQTHKELIKRDIFDPLRMKSSFFRVPSDASLRAHIAIPSKNSHWADRSLGDVEDPAGGQYSSLGDLATVMRTLLSPTSQDGVISPSTVRGWLMPLFTWGSASQEVGAPWEITTVANKKAYTKSGDLPGYHSVFALIPDQAVGIIVLVTGEYSDTATIAKEVGRRFVSVYAKLHEEKVKEYFAGTWVHGDDIAEVEVKKGALQLKKLVIRGIDVLSVVQKGLKYGFGSERNGPAPVVLWNTGHVGEFRMAFGVPQLNEVKDIGCMPYWVMIDSSSLSSRGAPLDLLYWNKGVLSYPSAGVNFSRKG